jgi:predicted nucleic acid-binding Zn ribbon protein
MSDPKPDACEVCGTGPVDIVLYPVAVHYKGSGFYSTDYGRGSRKTAKDGAESSGGSEGGGESGGEKTEKKPETKAEPKKAAEA